MTRTPVDSSNVHSVGHDETGLEVQFHRTGCARGMKPPKGETIQAGCNCIGGDVWHYADVPAHVHQAMMSSPSLGSHFTSQVKNAKDAYGILKYPATKRDQVKP